MGVVPGIRTVKHKYSSLRLALQSGMKLCMNCDCKAKFIVSHWKRSSGNLVNVVNIDTMTENFAIAASFLTTTHPQYVKQLRWQSLDFSPTLYTQ